MAPGGSGAGFICAPTNSYRVPGRHECLPYSRNERYSTHLTACKNCQLSIVHCQFAQRRFHLLGGF